MPKNIAAASDPKAIDPKKSAADPAEDESPDDTPDDKDEEEDENKKGGAKEDAAGNGKDGEKKDEKKDGEGGESAAAVQPAANTTERARIASILTAPEAKGRDALARHFALETDMSVDSAKKALAAAPKESSLAAAMAARGDSVVGDANPTQPRDHGWGRSIAKVCGPSAAKH